MKRGKTTMQRQASSFYLALFVLLSASPAHGCDQNSTDCQALLKFKDAITSDPGNHLRNWVELNPFCNWTGVTCHRQIPHRVVSIELVNKGLQGNISPFLSNLSLLTNLSLQENRFYGEIPDSMGCLSELVYVNLSNNKLGGEVPASLRSCNNLQALDLALNNLSGAIPDELGQMKSLTYLVLSGNNLTGVVPSSLSNLTALTWLGLAVNYLTGKIPPELGALTKLEILYLHSNYLDGAIPPSIGNCSALREVSLLENQLIGEIPTELGLKMGNLKKLYLQNNRLSGEIPVSLSNLSKLTLLDLSLNQLDGEVPLELGQLNNLEILYLHSNNLVSNSNNTSLDLLSALTNCSYLRKLHLRSCQFAGTLPSSIGGLSKDLYYFNLWDNLLTGPIPKGIGNLSSLVNLNLGYNSFNGMIPATLGKLGQLQQLYLGRNKLNGQIPIEVGQIGNLGLLDLGSNSVSGSIPPSLGNLSQLRYLYLFKNNLTGYIPKELAKCSLLMLLDLSFNNLQRSIPGEVGHLSNLALYLNLSNNNLQGEIPVGIGNLVSVQAVDLSNNRISGSIPSSIGSCIALTSLNLSCNVLQGKIPDSFEKINSLEVLDLAHNELTGVIPVWIANEQAIKILNLSYNQLTGEVPNVGRFKDLNGSLFIGNAGLCSHSMQMGLPRCKGERHKHNTMKWVYCVLAGVLLCALATLAIIATFRGCFRKLKDTSPLTSSTPHGFKTYTLRELEIATSGFNEKNLLGRGSFGSVYKAIVEDGKMVVAVKVLHGECAKTHRNFRRECQILSEIRHRNLVKMVGWAWSSQFKALVLEFVSNGNLEQHLYPEGSDAAGCKLKLQERISTLIDVAHGLEYLHENCSAQIVHCDLKPQNVLIDEDMVARVTDFGVGKLILADKEIGHHSTTGFMRGTVGYIPPEYGQGIISTKGDIYSFGVMLFETMTGKRPTSEMFSGGLDLRKWVNSALAASLWDAVAISLMQEAESASGRRRFDQFEQIYVHVLEVGIMCTEENPQKRPSMSLVVRRLEDAKKEIGLMNNTARM